MTRRFYGPGAVDAQAASRAALWFAVALAGLWLPLGCTTAPTPQTTAAGAGDAQGDAAAGLADAASTLADVSGQGDEVVDPCVPAPECDDKNPCTDDSCDPFSGDCKHVPNTAPCTDDCGGGTCTNGSCGSDSPLWQDSLGLGQSSLAQGVVADGTDWVVAGTAGAGSHVFVARVSASGKKKSGELLGSGSNFWVSGLRAGGGGFALSGRRAGSASLSEGWLMHTDSQGHEEWTVAIDCGNPDSEPTGLVARPDGYAVLARCDYSAPALVLTDLQGKVQTVAKLPMKNVPTGYAMSGAAGGGYVVAGSVMAPTSGSDAMLTRLDAKGAILWQHVYFAPANETARAVVEQQDGSFLVAGGTAAYGMQESDFWLKHISSQGEELSTTKIPGDIMALAPMPDAGVLAMGQQFVAKTGDYRAWALRLASGGYPVWSYSGALEASGKDGPQVWAGAAATASGAAVLAGWRVTDVYGATDTVLASLDPWGNASCTLAGKCAKTLLPGCDDGEPCTVDGCSAGSCTHVGLDLAKCTDGGPCTAPKCVGATCTYVAANDKKPCEDGNACTANEACSGGACIPLYTPMWTAQVVDGLTELGVDLVPQADGGSIVLMEQTGSGLGLATRLVRVDGNGKTLWNKEIIPAAQDLVPQALVPQPDKSVWVIASTSENDYDGSWFAAVDGTGKILWSKNDLAVPGSTYRARGAVPQPGGGAIVLAVGGGTTTLARLNAQGAYVADTAIYELDSVAAEWTPLMTGPGDALYLVTGGTDGSPETAGGVQLTRLTSALKVEWTANLGSAAAFNKVGATAVSNDGSVLVPLLRNKPKLDEYYWEVWCVGPAGQILWQHDELQWGSYGLLGAAAAKDSGFILARTVGSNSSAALERVDVFGYTHWQAVYNAPEMGWVQTVKVAAGGGYIGVGQVVNSKSLGEDLWLVRTDNWGNLSCFDSGKCWQLAISGCDDGLKCTADSCSATGCSHMAIAGCTNGP